jgi:hypothetical protein
VHRVIACQLQEVDAELRASWEMRCGAAVENRGAATLVGLAVHRVRAGRRRARTEAGAGSSLLLLQPKGL